MCDTIKKGCILVNLEQFEDKTSMFAFCLHANVKFDCENS